MIYSEWQRRVRFSLTGLRPEDYRAAVKSIRDGCFLPHLYALCEIVKDGYGDADLTVRAGCE